MIIWTHVKTLMRKNYLLKIYFCSKSHERTISDLECKHAQNLWKQLIIKDLDEYHDYYLKRIDPLLA